MSYQVGQVANYYERMTESYLQYGGQTLGWHFGLWEDETKSFESALINSNKILIEGCDMRPGQLVLDAGCGVGGLAFYLATMFGVDVIGITSCRHHVDMATQFAKERGLNHQVEFRLLDFMNLDFEDESFDFVLNQESFCYALNKKDYLRDVYMVLKSGGRWQAVDFFRNDKPFTKEQDKYHRIIQRGYKVPAFPFLQVIQSSLLDLGFEDIYIRDLSEMVYPSAFIFIRNWILNEKKRPSLGSEETELFAEHFAGPAFSYGLLEGAFTFQMIGGKKKLLSSR